MVRMTSLSLIYVVTSSKEEALSIGRALLEKKVAACVNAIEGMESLYWWEGKIESARECVLIVKTTTEKVDQSIAVIKAMHSYKVPCAISWKIERGSADYLQWLEKSVG